MNFEIIVPCKNEQDNIKIFYGVIKKALKNYNFFIKFIDDGSNDETWNEIKKIKKNNKKISGIKLLKNYGKENAITAGLQDKINEFDFKIVIDGDLQHPIKTIPQMIRRWKGGEKVVGTFRDSFQEGFVREIGSSIFYFLMKKFADIKMIKKTTDFMLIDRNIIKKYSKITEKNKSFRSTINLIHNIKNPIKIRISQRVRQNSKFNFLNLLKLGINTFTSFSIFPLKIIGYFGFFLSCLSTLAIPALFILNFFEITPVSYQTIIILLLVLLSGLILVSNGISAIYITKIYENVNSRPDYIIEKNI
jgi:dolichol-phosphate mannosyltransferase